MFWLWMFLIMLAIVGVTVLAAKVLTPPRNPGDPDQRRRNITALKVSGAFPHRKSNRN
jgi:hypothetical protein